MKEFFFEIGTEEIPAVYFPGVLDQLAEKTGSLLKKYKLEHEPLETCGTPRRLVVYSPGVDEVQKTEPREIMGPPKQAAFDADGKPTKAAEGFARSKGVTVNDLKIVQTAKGEFISVVYEEKGKTAQELLPLIFAELIQSLYFPKMMRWGNSDLRFVRPVQWILVQFDGKPVPCEFHGLKNQGTTSGHRLLAPEKIEVTDFSDYKQKLDSMHVEIDPAKREQIIREEIDRLLDAGREFLLDDPVLMNENVNVVEYPGVFKGTFQQQCLDLPQPVLISSIKKHQKAFAVVDSNGKIVPVFLVVSNMPLEDMSVIRAGYEQVLGARLADAHFFFSEDMKLPFAERFEQLAHVVYQKELGSLADKVERLRKIIAVLCGALNINSEYAALIDRAAYLCKSDLVTEMVKEFPELQGIMGREYAVRSGEPEEVAVMIGEHYLPGYSGDKLPSASGGAVLALADKLDAIIGGFGLDMIPSGTKDPYGLRRAGRGFVEIICSNRFSFSLTEIIKQSTAVFESLFQKEAETVNREVREFIRERLERYMLDKGIKYDTVNAVMATRYDDIHDLAVRMETFEEFRKSPDFEPLAVAFKRAGRIVTEEAGITINEKYLVEPTEKELYELFNKVQADVSPLLEQKDYLKSLQIMATIRPVLDRFYDDVLVMHEDDNLRINRLTFMKCLSDFFCRIADFTKLVIEKNDVRQNNQSK